MRNNSISNIFTALISLIYLTESSQKKAQKSFFFSEKGKN